VNLLDLEQNLNSSIEYTRRLFADLGRLVVLIILNIVPIVNLIVAGYYAKTVRETPGSDSPPRLEQYGDLWIDGLKIVIATIVYMIVPLILIIVGALSLFTGFMWSVYGPGIMMLPAGLSVTLLVAGIILAFAVAIIMAMAVVHMVKIGSFGKAFAVGEILNIIRKIGWGKYILWLIVIFVFAVIVGALSQIPAVGWIISLIVSPVFGVFAARSAALMYASATSPAAVSARPVEPQEKKFCMACGAQIPKETTYCPLCGKPQ
jgi:ribosomal protein L40E